MSISPAEVRKHSTKDDCWIIIHGKVYDITLFVTKHPGGSAILLKYAGKDGTKAFDPIHPIDIIARFLPPECCLGEVEVTTKSSLKGKTKEAKTEKKSETEEDDIEDEVGCPDDEWSVEYDRMHISESKNDAHNGKVSDENTNNSDDDEDDDDEDDEEIIERRKYNKAKPPLSLIYNLHDFEFVARHAMDKIGWAYYSSGCDDEITLRENHLSYQRVLFKPRILRDVTEVNTSTTMLGTKTSCPFYITATALGKLGHKDGEKVLTRQAARQDVIQMIPTLASCSFDEIVDVKHPLQTQWFQLYVNQDREVTKELVQHAEKRGVTALFITVDAPQLGRREKDMRSKDFEDLSHVQDENDNSIDRSQGAARAISSFIDTGLTWELIKWFRLITKMKILLKGVQCVEDVLMAVEHGVDGVVLSNHGGRQLEYSPSPIEVLAEVVPILKQRGDYEKLEIYIDGGVRRATDVLKAVCLGAKGVGIGRPFLYAMSTYGDDGVYKAIQILKDEMIMNMRLLGVNTIDQLNELYIDTRRMNRYIPGDNLFDTAYERLKNPGFKL